jgi:hypothetical protein
VERALARRLVKLSPGDAQRLSARLKRESEERGFTYDKEEGKRSVINLHPLPVVLSTADRARLHRLGLGLRSILARVLPLARKHAALSGLVPLEPEEEAFLGRVHSRDHDVDPAVLFRLDVDIDFRDPGWDENCKFFEFNGSAVGGYFYSKLSEALLADVVGPAVGYSVPQRVIEGMPDMMLASMREQSFRLGRRGQNFAYVEDRTWTTGITEGPSLMEFFRSQGANAVVCDPRDLYMKGNEIWVGDLPVDAVYRNMEIRDLIAIEKEDGHLRAMEQAFARNQVVSSIWGDFDHKSLWELLDTPEALRGLSAAQRAYLRAHIPWTRMLRHAFTRSPEGERVDLLEFVRDNRQALVIKPNRGCGGNGVTLGIRVDQSGWEAAIQTAATKPGEWVVQRYIATTSRPFPVISDSGVFELEDLYTAYGFVATPQGFGCLGRASRGAIVNVSQGGGVFPVVTLAG